LISSVLSTKRLTHRPICGVHKGWQGAVSLAGAARVPLPLPARVAAGRPGPKLVRRAVLTPCSRLPGRTRRGCAPSGSRR
jgi:hypothetical protein